MNLALLCDQEIEIILSFIPPQELLLNFQLVSKSLQSFISKNDWLWKGMCNSIFLSEYFQWESDLELVDKEFSGCFHLGLFKYWSTSIPKVLKVGRLRKRSKLDPRSEFERSLYSQFDTALFSFKHLTQLVTLLNIFALVKQEKSFYGHIRGGFHWHVGSYESCKDEDVFMGADLTPYDNSPSIWRDFVWVTLSNMEDSKFAIGSAIAKDCFNNVIAVKMPLGAFCLMILSNQQQNKIQLIEQLLKSRMDRSSVQELNNLTLGVSAPNDIADSHQCVCYFNRMYKNFKSHEGLWINKRVASATDSWLPMTLEGFTTRYKFVEKKDQKLVSMNRECFYFSGIEMGL